MLPSTVYKQYGLQCNKKELPMWRSGKTSADALRSTFFAEFAFHVTMEPRFVNPIVHGQLAHPNIRFSPSDS